MIVAPLLLLLLPLPQSPSTSPLTTGTRVRVTARGDGPERRLVGPLRTFDGEALTLIPEGSADHVTVPRETITRIEVSRGSRSRAGRGALIGAVLGLAAIAIAESTRGENYEAPDNYGLIVAGSIAGGAVVGAGVGALMRSEKWEAQPWAVGPGRRAAGPVSVKVTLRF
jgi:hypothetical protein